MKKLLTTKNVRNNYDLLARNTRLGIQPRFSLTSTNRSPYCEKKNVEAYKCTPDTLRFARAKVFRVFNQAAQIRKDGIRVPHILRIIERGGGVCKESS